MSLVNDFLIEAERRHDGAPRPRAAILDDLVGVDVRSSIGRSATRSRAAHTVLFRAAGIALVGLAAVASFFVSRLPGTPPTLATQLERIERRLDLDPPTLPPSVAAPPAAALDPAAIDPEATSGDGPTVEDALPIESASEPDALNESDDSWATAFEAEVEWVDDEQGRTPGARVIAPSLGDPLALSIEPSRRDRERAAARAELDARARLVRSARAARRAQRFAEAESAYAEARRLAPGDASVLIEWCEVVAEQGRLPEALEQIEAARAHVPRNRPLLLGHAQLLARSGDLEGAIARLEAAGFGPTEAPDVHALVAAYLQRAGRHDQAIERYERLLRRFPEETRGWLGLGISLEAVGRRPEARDVYRIALSVGELPSPTRSWVTSRLGALQKER